MKRTALILFFATLAAHALTIPFMNIPYDEAAYSWTARNLVQNGGWFDLYGSGDLFFFPPLFNYLAALLVKFGVDRLYAVRIVTTLFSSGIPPLMYLLAVRSGLTQRAGLIAAALWIMLPWGWHLSVVGMVETPWICCLLVAVWFLQSAVERGVRRDIVLSALALGAALWIKETALGTLPLFLFALRRDRRAMFLWGGLFGLIALPLLVQSLLPHEYDLFYEITTPLLIWNNLGIDALLQSWGVIYGAMAIPWPGWFYTFVLVTLVVAAFAVAAVPRDEWRDRFILRFAAGFLLIYLPFFMLFPKKFPYYLLPVQLFLSLFVGRWLATRTRTAIGYGAVLLAVAVPAFLQLADRSDEESYREAFTAVAQEKPGARIGITLPRKAEYVAERSGMTPNLRPIEWMHCAGKGDECIAGNDYIMSDTMFLMMTYCRHWPMSPENCDLNALSATKARMTPLLKRNDFNLYRMEPENAP